MTSRAQVVLSLMVVVTVALVAVIAPRPVSLHRQCAELIWDRWGEHWAVYPEDYIGPGNTPTSLAEVLQYDLHCPTIPPGLHDRP